MFVKFYLFIFLSFIFYFFCICDRIWRMLNCFGSLTNWCDFDRRLAREAGLEYVEIQNLTEFYDDNRCDFGPPSSTVSCTPPMHMYLYIPGELFPSISVLLLGWTPSCLHVFFLPETCLNIWITF